MNDAQTLEQRLNTVAVAPRVTLDMVMANIAEEHYTVVYDVLTICVLKLKNGFTVTGESACAAPENFHKEIGEEIAKRNAVAKIWALMGYELKTKLALVDQAVVKPHGQLLAYVGTKVVNAMPMNRRDYNVFRGWDLPANENGADEGYLVEYTDREDGQVPGFKGYISWSPKDVFERAYTDQVPVKDEDDFKTRMKAEYGELLEKIRKLTAFLESDAADHLSVKDVSLLLRQGEAMRDYATVLHERIAGLL